MSTTSYLFMGFITLGLIFYFISCINAAKPASGTTEWIKYKCGRKFTFCPYPNPLTKYDIIPILLLTLASIGLMLFSSAFLSHLKTETPPLSALIDIPLLSMGEGYIYPSHILWVCIVPILYVFLKNLSGGYIVPISGVVLMFIDSTSLLLSHNSAAIGTTLFTLIAFYLIYRYISVSQRHYYFLGIGIAFGIAISFNAATSIAILGIITIFVIKEIFYYLKRKNKQQTILDIIMFVIFCIILPFVIYFTITILCNLSEYTSFTASLLNAGTIFIAQFKNWALYPIAHLSMLSLMVFIGGIFAVPCCIYQAAKAKDGNSLFVLIPFVVCLPIIFVSGLTGLLPIFAIPVITCSFASLTNRKLNTWVFVYLFTSALYLCFLYSISLI